MGIVIVTILVTASTFAVLSWFGLIRCAWFTNLPSCSRLCRLARDFKQQIAAKLSTLPGRIKVRSCICPKSFKELSIRLKLSEATCRLRSLILGIRSRFPGKAETEPPVVISAEPDMTCLNCRIYLEPNSRDVLAGDIYVLEICGTIHSPSEKHEASLKVTMLDVTESAMDSKPVLAKSKQWGAKDSGEFCFTAELGRLTGRDTILPNWTSLARLSADWLMFARRGRRRLQVRAAIVSRHDSQELACAVCNFTRDNAELGYIDFEENRQRAKTLAVALAFTVSASDGKMFNCEVDLIKDWARQNICSPGASSGARRQLDKALNKTFTFFREGHLLKTREICRELVQIVSAGDIRDIVGFCLSVSHAKGSVSPDELALLNDLAGWLEVDPDVYRSMMERALPVNIHQVKDAGVVLGVTPDMTEEKARRHLNREFSKWNARVTNCDPQIQAQADEMLSLIAEARQEYVG